MPQANNGPTMQMILQTYVGFKLKMAACTEQGKQIKNEGEADSSQEEQKEIER